MDRMELESRINFSERASTKIATDVSDGRFSAHLVSIRIVDQENRFKTFPTTHGSIDLILSNLVTDISFQNGDKDVSMKASAVICDGGLGRLYESSDENETVIQPFLCAEIQIKGNNKNTNITEDIYTSNDEISFIINMGEREFFYILHLIGAGSMCIVSVEAELCLVDERKYILVNHHQHIHPKLNFRFLTNYLGLNFTSKELIEMITNNSPISLQLRR